MILKVCNLIAQPQKCNISNLTSQKIKKKKLTPKCLISASCVTDQIRRLKKKIFTYEDLHVYALRSIKKKKKRQIKNSTFKNSNFYNAHTCLQLAVEDLEKHLSHPRHHHMS